MEQYVIKGGTPLQGKVTISGAKNAALGILAASVMTDEEVSILNVPGVNDTAVMLDAIRAMGGSVIRKDVHSFDIRGRDVDPYSPGSDTLRKIRAGYYFIGAMLGKYRYASVPLPGGCNIGSRPIDQHIKGFRALGASVNVDAGDVLSHFNGFRGEASGRLHGKTKIFLKDGQRIRLSDAFLYSSPGETGKIKMDDASVVTDNLALAGIDDAARANVANALADLDYNVLRFDLKRKEGKVLALSVRVEGSATRGDVTVPVNLTLNFNGEIEQLINTGLGYSRKLKGTSK